MIPAFVRRAGVGLVLAVLLLGTAGPVAGEDEGARPAAPAVPLHLAALQGGTEVVRQHAAAGTDLDAKDPYGSTPLSIAATFGHLGVVEALLEGGADPDLANTEGSTPLHAAALFGRLEIVEVLLAAGADRHARNAHGSAPIDIVASPVEDDRELYARLRQALGPLGLTIDEATLEAARPRIFAALRPKPDELEEVDYAPLARDDWPVGAPETVGLSPALVAEVYAAAAHLETLRSLLVVKNGKLVAEAYFHGGGVDTPDLVQSVTKSVLSALVGIAIEQEKVPGLDAKLLDSFPEQAKRVKDPRKREITLGQMLAMRGGYPWEEATPETWEALMSGDYVPCVADVALANDPGTAMQYSNVTSHLLGVVVARAFEGDLLDVANEHLFGPLGVEPGDWYADPRGYRFGHAMLHLKPRDMARFGYLYLSDGRWGDRQVVPAAWVKASLEPRTERVSGTAGVENGRAGRYHRDIGYGYQWWSATVGEQRFPFAWGHGGQFIVLLDDLDMVIVTTAEPFLRPVRHDAEAWKHEQSILDLIGFFVRLLPAPPS